MAKKGNIVSAIFSRLLFIGFSAQIIMGLAWMVMQFDYLQLFGDTSFYVTVSSNLKCDEYTGVLYPALLLIIRSVCTIIPISWYSVMYFLQFGFAVFAGTYFLKAIEFQKGKLIFCIWGALVIATFPFILQCHMAILPNSLSLSLAILSITFTGKAWNSLQQIDGKAYALDIGGACLFWMLCSLCEIRFLLIAGILLVMMLVRSLVLMKKSKIKGFRYSLIVFFCFAIITCGLINLTQTRGLYGRPEMSVESVLYERVAWKSRIMRVSSWTPQLCELVDQDILDETRAYQGNVDRLLMPTIEKKIGVKQAREYYLDTVKLVLQKDIKELIHDMGIDFVASFISPVFVRMFLSGSTYISYTIRNYDVMIRNNPVYSRYYFDFSLLWFEIALIVSGVSFMLGILRKDRSKDCIKFEGNRGYLIPAVVVSVLLAVWGAFQASGTYDYKQTLFTTSFFLVLMMCSLRFGEE